MHQDIVVRMACAKQNRPEDRVAAIRRLEHVVAPGKVPAAVRLVPRLIAVHVGLQEIDGMVASIGVLIARDDEAAIRDLLHGPAELIAGSAEMPAPLQDAVRIDLYQIKVRRAARIRHVVARDDKAAVGGLLHGIALGNADARIDTEPLRRRFAIPADLEEAEILAGLAGDNVAAVPRLGDGVGMAGLVYLAAGLADPAVELVPELAPVRADLRNVNVLIGKESQVRIVIVDLRRTDDDEAAVGCHADGRRHVTG